MQEVAEFVQVAREKQMSCRQQEPQVSVALAVWRWLSQEVVEVAAQRRRLLLHVSLRLRQQDLMRARARILRGAGAVLIADFAGSRLDLL